MFFSFQTDVFGNVMWQKISLMGLFSLISHVFANTSSGVFTGRNEVVAKVIFLHMYVILFTEGRGLSASVHAGIPTPQSPEQTPPRADTPWSRHPPKSRHPPGNRHPSGADTPLGADPPGADPPGADIPQSRHPPGNIRSMSSRYASYWNAFLFRLETSHFLSRFNKILLLTLLSLILGTLTPT